MDQITNRSWGTYSTGHTRYNTSCTSNIDIWRSGDGNRVEFCLCRICSLFIL